MRRDRFIDAELVYSYDPAVGKHRRLMNGWPEHRSIVNAYLGWLRELGVAYEVRLHHQNFYLIKSRGLRDAIRSRRSLE